MIHFHSLRVSKVQKETEDCVSVLFEVPPELKDIFRFKQGQNLTIKKTMNGEEIRRNYSICSSPFEGNLKVAVKKVEDGIFSSYVNDHLKPGDILDVMPPTGNFNTELQPGQKKKYLAFAAGSGITPVLSIIKTTLITEPLSEFTLVFGNRTKNHIIFKEELEGLKDKFIDRFRLFHILSRERTDSVVNNGRIDPPKLLLLDLKIVPFNTIDEFFLCGPAEMIFCIRNYLLEKNIPEKQIHFELFTIPGTRQSVRQVKDVVNNDTGPKAAISVKLDGIMFDFELGYNGASILDAALKTGADLPFACKGGVCTTCKARLKEGKVAMDVNWGLEPDEVEKGFILTCQSHPLTDKVVIDFDAK